MKTISISSYIKKGITASMTAGLILSAVSCDAIYDDLDPCPQGVRLRFVETENIDEGNIFYTQVDCLTLFIYDSEGKYLQTRKAYAPEIKDENWRMEIDLLAGQYKLLAYGGMDCEESSFSFTSDPATISLQDVMIKLDSEYLSKDIDKPLHYLFHGLMDLEIPKISDGADYIEATLHMMKDTNDIRILLANENGLPTDVADFDINIISDNTLMNYMNDLVPTTPATYWPWSAGNSEVGLTEDGEPATIAYAELSIPRLVYENPTTLLITRKSDGKEVVRLPLINILMLYKSDRPQFSRWTPQQFLDRESRWVMTFFLTADGRWLDTKIVVNDWIVRINNIDDL